MRFSSINLRRPSMTRHAAWIVLTALVAGGLGVYFRLYPITVFPRDLSLNTAKFMVIANIRKASAAQVRQLNPALSPTDQARQVEAIVSKKISGNPKEFKRLMGITAAQLEKEARAVSKGGYLLEVDPYYYMSQTERILSTGKIADRVRGREFLNPMTLAPTGYWYPMDLHPYVGAVVYKLVSIIRSDVDLTAVLRWVPLGEALAALAVFLIFTGRVVGLSGWAGFLGCVYLMLCPMFLKRSLVGWYDTDPYNVLFPLVALTGIFIAFGSSKPARERWIGSCVAGAGFALHALFWRGWVVPFVVILAFLTAALAVPRSRRGAGLTTPLYASLLLPMVLLPAAAILTVWGPAGLAQEITAAADFVRGFIRPALSPWPDVFITVGELKPMGLRLLTDLLGGPAWVVFGMTGLALRFFREFKTDKEQTVPLAVLFGITCVAFAVSLRIQRFAILAAAPLAVAMPFAWVEWRQRLNEWLPKIFVPHAVAAIRLQSRILSAATAVALITLLSVRAQAEIVHFYPLFNPAWDRMMAQVREKTPPNAIITGWWSPGHFLTSVGKRRVTIDGSSQDEPQSYWVANLFIENSERNALAILRMLDTSGNEAVAYLGKKGHALPDSVDLIKSILPLSRKDARSKLIRKFSSSEAEELLRLTHGNGQPPPGYLFLYNHMIEQALALDFIGRWDFRKASSLIKRLHDDPQPNDKKLLSRATPENTKLLWSMTDKPAFYESEAYQSAREGDTLLFSNGVRINLSTNDVQVKRPGGPSGRPQSVFRINADNELIETPVPGATLAMSVLLIEDHPAGSDGKPVYRSVLMARRWASSMAMRLYYLGGKGLKFIRPVASEDSAMNRSRFLLYEVDWAGFEDFLETGRLTKATSSGPDRS